MKKKILLVVLSLSVLMSVKGQKNLEDRAMTYYKKIEKQWTKKKIDTSAIKISIEEAIRFSESLLRFVYRNYYFRYYQLLSMLLPLCL